MCDAVAVRTRIGPLLAVLLAITVACTDDDAPAVRASDGTTTTTTSTSTVPSTTAVGEVTTSSAPPSTLTSFRLAPDSLGPIRVGMTLAEAERAGGVALHADRLDPESDCATWFPTDGAAISFLAIDDRLATIDVGAPVVTVEGIGAGATTADIVAAYGDAHVEERTNRFQVREVAVTPVDAALADYGIVFLLSTVGDGVEHMRAGLARELTRDEGCA
jgi:hypothetical protein